MAKSSTRRASTVSSTMGNLTQAVFLQHHDDVIEKLRLKKEADSALSNAYKAAGRNGVDIKELKRAIAMSALSAEERAMSDAKQRRYLEWLGRPIGTQATMFTEDDPQPNGHDRETAEAVHQHEQSEAYEAGVAAGKAGAAIESITSLYQPGTEEFQSASQGWAEGQRLAVAALG